MLQKRFYHEVVTPTRNLLTRAAENVCIEPEFSDVVSLAKIAAQAAYHFREPILRRSGNDNVGPMTDQSAQSLRERLGDAANSAKHGPLRDDNRSTTFRASLAFEYDRDLGFRFLRTEVLATNKRFGTFELSEIILEFIPLLSKELGVDWTPEEMKLQSHPFKEWAETYLTSKSGPSLEQTGIGIYQRDANGTLTLVDPPEVKFRVCCY